MHEEVKPMGRKVARMLDIDGSRVIVIRKYAQSGIVNIQAFPGMPIHLNDHIKTDARTQAVIEFDIGGRGGISPDSEIVVTTQRSVETVGNPYAVKANRVWAKIDKQKTQLQIQTDGGVIGIEG